MSRPKYNMEFRRPKPISNGGNGRMNCSDKSLALLEESQHFCAEDNNDWVDCSKRRKHSHSETSQQYSVSADNASSGSSLYYHRRESSEVHEKITSVSVRHKNEDDYNMENAQNSINILNSIPESSDYIESVRKMTKDMINTAIEESTIKKLLKPYVEKHKVTKKSLHLLRPGKTKLTKSVSTPCSPSILQKNPSNSKRVNWSTFEDAESDKSVLKNSICFVSLEIMVTALKNEKGPRSEAAFFIRSLCRDIIRTTHIILDDITEEIDLTLGNAASLIADMVQKELEPVTYRGYTLEDIGIGALVENLLDCIPDSTRISQFGGGRNNFVHNIIKNLIPSDEIRKIVLNSLCLAIKRSYCLFYVTFNDINISSVIIPPAEINGLFHYFQLLTMVILCSSEEPWMELTEVEKIKELEAIALTKLPMRLIATYASRTAVFALKYQKKPLEMTEV